MKTPGGMLRTFYFHVEGSKRSLTILPGITAAYWWPRLNRYARSWWFFWNGFKIIYQWGRDTEVPLDDDDY